MRARTALSVLGFVAIVSGQTAVPATPAFEVASVKPNKSATGMTLDVEHPEGRKRSRRPLLMHRRFSQPSRNNSA
jgi:hypothetical protein